MTERPNDLIDTIEKLRAERYPDLPSDLVRSVLELEAQYSEDNDAARRLISQLIEARLGDES